MSNSASFLLSRLRPVESVQWSGRPVPAWWLMRGSFYRIPFSLAWLMLAVSWYDGLDVWWRALPLLVGLYIAVGRFFVEYIEAKGISYTITNQRVLIESRILWRRRHWVYELSRVTDLGVAAAVSGAGTVFLCRPNNLLAWAVWNRGSDHIGPLPNLTASPGCGADLWWQGVPILSGWSLRLPEFSEMRRSA